MVFFRIRAPPSFFSLELRKEAYMSYNKSSEEKKWRKWKNNEEKLLKEYGLTEEKIQELRNYDWKQFNEERRFRERQVTGFDYMGQIESPVLSLPVRNFHDILDQLQDEELHAFLKKLNQQTMDILYLKVIGYSVKEIAEMMGLKEDVIRYRIRVIRKKLKK